MSIQQQMQANSKAWHTADASTRKKLEAENQRLGKSLGASYNSSTGTWSNSSGGSLYGGGSPSTGSNTSKSTGGSNRSPSGGVLTNTSYNGDFITVDNNIDYQSKINEAVGMGDYASAARYEAARNAKILNLGFGSDQTTSNYIQPYSSPTNNQGGMVYTDKYNINNAPSGWSTIRSNGATYRNDGENIFQQTGGNSSGPTWTQVGNGINPNTGEFTWNNADSARDFAYNEYIGSGGNQDVAKEYALQNLIQQDYINALMGGNAGQFTSDMVASAKAEQERKAAILAQKEEERVKAASQFGSSENSFEAEFTPQEEEFAIQEDKEDAYNNYIMTLMTGGRRHIK